MEDLRNRFRYLHEQFLNVVNAVTRTSGVGAGAEAGAGGGAGAGYSDED